MSVTADLPRKVPGDFYATPPICTKALLSSDPPPAGGAVWEPACGDGAISKVLHSSGYDVVSTDLFNRGYGEAGVDFLRENNDRGVISIVTNPPFLLADAFALHALEMGLDYLALFGRLAWIEGEKRRQKLWSIHPPNRILAFSSRQTLWRGDDPNPKTTGGTTAYAWFIWKQRTTHCGTTLDWLRTAA